MFFSTWETYHTHTLFLGYFNGPTEGLIIATLIMLLSGIYGPGLWRAPLASLFGFESILGSLNFVDVWVPIILIGFFCAHLPDCVRNVANARRERGQPVLPLLKEWTPMLIFCISLLLWIGSPESSILSRNYVTLLCLMLSFAFGRMTTKIILAHLTKQPFPYWTVMLFPIVGGAVITNLRFIGLGPIDPEFEFLYLWISFGFCCIAYFRWATLVIGAICDFLGINCLTIPKEKYEAAVRAKYS